MSLKQLHCSCSFPFSINSTERFRNRFSSSQVCFSKKRQWRIQVCPVTSSDQRGLLPRPKYKPLKISHGVEEEGITLQENSRKSSRISAQIEKLVVCKLFQEALELFEMIECEGGLDLGITTYDALVNACISIRSIRWVKRVLNHIISSDFELDQYLRNRVLLMHVRCKMMIDARMLFDEMPKRNFVSWNIMIGGLVDSGDYKEAFRLFLVMWEEYSDAITRIFPTMIRASAGLKRMFVGRQVHCCVSKLGLKNTYVSCALIDMYSKCGSISDAYDAFCDMPNRTTVAWNSIISGYTYMGCSEEALSLYYEMIESGAKMDHFTFSILIRTCARLASVEHAKQAHAGLIRHGFTLDVVSNTALVDLYSKWGKVEDAQNVFDKMPSRNIMSWNALIAGYGNRGRGIEAVKLFERMIYQDSIAPNHVTFLVVLSACSYSGLSVFGREIFDAMSMVYKLKPRAMHYTCLVELLGREGRLDEAFALITDLPLKPTVNMWAALLTACRIHKNLVLGTFAAEKIYEMEPKEKISNYIVLLNIYRSSGKLEEASSVLQCLTRKGFRVSTPCTCIEIKKQMYSFVTKDQTHVKKDEIYKKLDELTVEISKHGYVHQESNFLPDVDENEDKMVSYHSERLAICYGLINSVCSTPLQLVQNHRICNDCHCVIKLISKVSQREITVRDASRFHHFKNGNCSCGDYW